MSNRFIAYSITTDWDPVTTLQGATRSWSPRAWRQVKFRHPIVTDAGLLNDFSINGSLIAWWHALDSRNADSTITIGPHGTIRSEFYGDSCRNRQSHDLEFWKYLYRSDQYRECTMESLISSMPE